MTNIKAILFAIAVSGASACVDPAGNDVPSEASGDSTAAAPDSASTEEAEAIEPLAIVPQAANSSSIALTSGTRAAEAFFNRSGGDAACSGPCIALFDAKCDAHQVYVEFQINGGGVTRRNNGGGCGTTLRIPLSGSFNIAYRSCVDIQLAPDACGPMRFDHNP
jgi:hypothetical protein